MHILVSLCLEGNVRNHFAMNASTGVLSCLSLDRESIVDYQLVIEAHDNAQQRRSTECRLSIRVIDRNDNAPIFDSIAYNASVLENATIGSIIMR